MTFILTINVLINLNFSVTLQCFRGRAVPRFIWLLVVTVSGGAAAMAAVAAVAAPFNHQRPVIRGWG